MLQKRQEIINALIWEICKTVDDATSEFDRTILFIEATISAYREMNKSGNIVRNVSNILAYIRRSAIGIIYIYIIISNMS